MECSKMTEKLSLYIDGMLDERTLESVEAHLAECASCRSELDSLRTLVAVCGQMHSAEPPADLRQRIAASSSREADRDDAGLAVLFAEAGMSEMVDPPSDLRMRILAATTARQARPTFAEWIAHLFAVRGVRWAGGAVAVGAIAITLIANAPQQNSPIKQSPVARTTVSRSAVAAAHPAQAGPVVASTQTQERTHRRAVRRSQKVARMVAQAAPTTKETAPRPAVKQPDTRTASAVTDEPPLVPMTAHDSEPARETVVAASPAKRSDSEGSTVVKPVAIRVASVPISIKPDSDWSKQIKEEAAMRRGEGRSATLLIVNSRF